jgi:glycosyltransferase involved in cell wall biosynthesis
MTEIAIDARLIRSGGIGSYIQSLLEGLAHVPAPYRYTLLGRPQDAIQSRYPSFRCKTVSTPVYSLLEHAAVPIALRGADLFHIPHYNVPFGVRAPLVTTIHDLIHIQFPGALRSRWALIYARELLSYALRKAKAIIVGSQATASALVEFCGAAERKIRFISYELPRTLVDATADESILAECSLRREEFFLFVGQLKPHKNIAGLVEAFAHFSKRDPTHRLVLVSYVSDPRIDLDYMIEARGLAGKVILLRKISFGRLKALYQSATALVLPSFAEGLGLPVIEAMALGTPVIASDIPAIREAAGDAGILVDPRSPEALASAMSELVSLGGLRTDMVCRGRRHISKFESVDVGAMTLRVYEEALG